jgi:hypothetical protein
VHGEGVEMGSDSEQITVTPGQTDYPVAFQFQPTRQLDQADLSGVDLRIRVHGPYAFSGFIGNSGKSWVTLPGYTASTSRSVLVSLDDPTFAQPTAATLTGSDAGWYAALPTPGAGEHTLYVESIQGFDTSDPVSQTFQVRDRGGRRR